jgi:hypothetical protein
MYRDKEIMIVQTDHESSEYRVGTKYSRIIKVKTNLSVVNHTQVKAVYS